MITHTKTPSLADDEDHLRLLVRTTLDHLEYQIVEATDGMTALDMARAVHIDLLIIDWMMSYLSGIEVTQLLKQDPITANIRIIILTAKSQEEDKSQAVAVDVYAYLVKPFSPLELMTKVNEILR